MPLDPQAQKPASPGASDAALHRDIADELERVRGRLAAIEARRLEQVASEQRERADRAAAREADVPGIEE